MKKIAIISEAFWGSTLPLLREFSKRGFAIDLYFLWNKIEEPEGCECSFTSTHLGINHMPKQSYESISRYIGPHVRAFSICLPRPFASVPIVRNISSAINAIVSRRVAKAIDAEKYDLVNLIANYDMERCCHLVHSIQSKLVISLHEVWNHANPNRQPSPLLKEVISKSCDVIVFSKNSLNDIHQIKGIDTLHIHMIPFGLFHSYGQYEDAPIKDQLPKHYILFFGSMHPYKGLSVLFQAIDLLGNEIGEYKIVLAGKADKDLVCNNQFDQRYTTFFRYIHNDELATLIRHAEAVICPHLSISQSGIPQTTFVFGKPIIASDLPAFREIVKEGVGLCFTTGNPSALAAALRSFITDTKLHNQLTANAQRFEELYPNFNWPLICNQYVEKFINN